MSTGFRLRSSRARSARVLSDLNSVDTDWSAFKWYRSKQINSAALSVLSSESIRKNGREHVCLLLRREKWIQCRPVYCLQRGNFPFSLKLRPRTPPADTSRKRSCLTLYRKRISYYNKRNAHFDVQELLFQFWTERRETWQEYGEA